MEWDSSRALREETHPRISRILATTSGNAQSRSLPTQQDEENYNSFPANSRWQLKSHNATSRSSVPSNDDRVLSRQRRNDKRIKRRIRLAEKYLHHPKFIAFKARPRKDVCKKTQEVIWTEETETAFQNAIINIPAMGRKKKSQHGKTFGRNELIMEWIKQETGKTRTRKQVSSHMQTLDKMFEPKPEEGFSGIPEFRMLTRGTEDPISGYDEPEFYENSIADMVQNWRILQASLYQQGNITENRYHRPQQLAEPASYAGRSLASLDFAMWVSHPDKMKKALHRYTRIQSNQTTAAPEPLENVQGWRNAWPELAMVIDRSASSKRFDIILLEASVELMLDFPPPGSKLASSLELEFAHSDYDNTLIDARPWQCSTWIYHDGQLQLEAKHKECHISGPGRVKPPFESKWWAEKFTRLTEKRWHAIESGREGAVKTAGQDIQSYLSNLTVMQHIARGPAIETLTEHTPTYLSNQQHGAILLWRFSQVTSRFVGTTTWRRLIPPPHRMAVNSPLPTSQNMELLALDLDTNMDTAFVSHRFEPVTTFLTHEPQETENVYMPASDEELCQDGFMIAAQQSNYSSFAMPTNHLEYVTHNNYSFHENMLHSTNTHDLHSEVSHKDALLHKDVSYDEHYRNNDRSSHTIENIQQCNPPPSDYGFAHPHSRSEALLSFDVNTSRMLQAQLQASNDGGRRKRSLSEPPSHNLITDQSFCLQEPPSSYGDGTDAASEAIHLSSLGAPDSRPLDYTHTNEYDSLIGKQHLKPLDQSEDQAQDEGKQQYLHVTDPRPAVIAPRATRPTLYHHHTYAGVLPTVSSSYTINNIDDIATRNDFTLLIDNIYNTHDDFFDHNPSAPAVAPGYRPGSDENATGIGLGITRAYSQPLQMALFPGFPVLMSNDVDDEPHLDGHGFVEEEQDVDGEQLDGDGLVVPDGKDEIGGSEGEILMTGDGETGIDDAGAVETGVWSVKAERV